MLLVRNPYERQMQLERSIVLQTQSFTYETKTERSVPGGWHD